MGRRRSNNIASGLAAFAATYKMTKGIQNDMEEADLKNTMKDGISKAQAEAADSGKSTLDSGKDDPNVADYQYANKADAASAKDTLNSVDSMQAEIDAQKAGGSVAPVSGPTGVATTPPNNEAGAPAAPSGLADMVASTKPAQSVVPGTGLDPRMSAVPAPGTTAPEPAPGLKDAPQGWSQVDKPKQDAMDIFHKKYAPAVMQKMLEQGKIGDAQKFEEWSTTAQGKSYGNAWLKAVQMEHAGDHDGAMMAVQDLYNKQMPDGKYATAVPGQDGQYTIEVRDEKTNKVVQQFAGKAPELSQALLGMGSPDKVYEHMSALEAAKTKREQDVADKKQAHEYKMAENAAKPDTPSSLLKLEQERDAKIAANPNDPSIKIWNRRIENLSKSGENGGGGGSVTLQFGSPDDLGRIPIRNPRTGRIELSEAPAGSISKVDQARNSLAGVFEGEYAPGMSGLFKLGPNGEKIALYGDEKKAAIKAQEIIKANRKPGLQK